MFGVGVLAKVQPGGVAISGSLEHPHLHPWNFADTGISYYPYPYPRISVDTGHIRQTDVRSRFYLRSRSFPKALDSL